MLMVFAEPKAGILEDLAVRYLRVYDFIVEPHDQSTWTLQVTFIHKSVRPAWHDFGRHPQARTKLQVGQPERGVGRRAGKGASVLDTYSRCS